MNYPTHPIEHGQYDPEVQVWMRAEADPAWCDHMEDTA